MPSSFFTRKKNASLPKDFKSSSEEKKEESFTSDDYQRVRQASLNLKPLSSTSNKESKAIPASLVNPFSFSIPNGKVNLLQELVEQNDVGRINKRVFKPAEVVKLLSLALAVSDISPKTLQALLDQLPDHTLIKPEKLRVYFKEKPVDEKSRTIMLQKQEIFENFLKAQATLNLI